jgi:very-short-patch-repair endonuclease
MDPRREVYHRRLLEIIAQKGGTYISGVYTNCRSRYTIRCDSGHEWEARYMDMMRTLYPTWCPACTEDAHYKSEEEIRALAAERGGHCVSEGKHRSRELLTWECARGHQFQQTLRDVIKTSGGRNWCNECSMRRSRRLDEFEDLAKRLGDRICVGIVKKRAHYCALWRCVNCDHEWTTQYSSHRGCRRCHSRSLKLKLERSKEMGKRLGYALLSTSYVHSTAPLLWRCDGEPAHEFVRCYAAMRNGKSKCPQCNESRGERVVRLYLQEEACVEFNRERCLSTLHYTRTRSDPLRFDFYVPCLNLAIEMDGGQHERSVPRFGGDRGLLRVMQRDETKRTFCLEYGVSLLRIPYACYTQRRVPETITTFLAEMRDVWPAPFVHDGFHDERLVRIAELSGGRETSTRSKTTRKLKQDDPSGPIAARRAYHRLYYRNHPLLQAKHSLDHYRARGTIPKPHSKLGLYCEEHGLDLKAVIEGTQSLDVAKVEA